MIDVEDAFETTAWVLAAYENVSNPSYTRYSKCHLLGPDGETLCGARQRMHFTHSDSGRCKTCYARAARAVEAVGAKLRDITEACFGAGADEVALALTGDDVSFFAFTKGREKPTIVVWRGAGKVVQAMVGKLPEARELG